MIITQFVIGAEFVNQHGYRVQVTEFDGLYVDYTYTKPGYPVRRCRSGVNEFHTFLGIGQFVEVKKQVESDPFEADPLPEVETDPSEAEIEQEKVNARKEIEDGIQPGNCYTYRSGYPYFVIQNRQDQTLQIDMYEDDDQDLDHQVWTVAEVANLLEKDYVRLNEVLPQIRSSAKRLADELEAYVAILRTVSEAVTEFDALHKLRNLPLNVEGKQDDWNHWNILDHVSNYRGGEFTFDVQDLLEGVRREDRRNLEQ